ncbi:glycoside hydrolase family 26 protein [Pedobacter metabolipauper]|uniref:Mannan endo-1,4-beta-mannosidase n=1 Tax=Pedobacter metabolipauper TaxID=425513 RepID=A0A4R6SQD3_9SPHI|nr:glycosyl hydrolase [Pedobacter metabolipauper]TDQ06339.1 mannan endo-1,4-beta-mannosidase [Pedobacter metabolipauper]
MVKRIILFLYVFGSFQFILMAQTADKNATRETKNLYLNLQRYQGNGVLFGHQDDMAYGVGWKYEKDRSDIKDLAGQYPAVLGWDVAGLEKNNSRNLDGVPFDQMRDFIKKAYDLGAVNTFSWHMDNPLNGNTAWDTTSTVTVKSMLPGGAAHATYKTWLNSFAAYVKTLKGSDGKLIPILFRPFHEHTGSWFWWGKKESTPQEYKALWQFTVRYLRDVKQTHNLIYVFNPSGFDTEAEYLERYPGNDYADVLSFDIYQYGDVAGGKAFSADLAKKVAIQHQIALKNKKITAIAEMGYVEIPDPKWWSEVVWKAIEAHQPSYLLVWRNAGYRKQENDQHYYAPYKGHRSSADFLELFNQKKLILQKGAQQYRMYSDHK